MCFGYYWGLISSAVLLCQFFGLVAAAGLDQLEVVAETFAVVVAVQQTDPLAVAASVAGFEVAEYLVARSLVCPTPF